MVGKNAVKKIKKIKLKYLKLKAFVFVTQTMQEMIVALIKGNHQLYHQLYFKIQLAIWQKALARKF